MDPRLDSGVHRVCAPRDVPGRGRGRSGRGPPSPRPHRRSYTRRGSGPARPPCEPRQEWRVVGRRRPTRVSLRIQTFRGPARQAPRFRRGGGEGVQDGGLSPRPCPPSSDGPRRRSRVPWEVRFKGRPTNVRKSRSTRKGVTEPGPVDRDGRGRTCQRPGGAPTSRPESGRVRTRWTSGGPGPRGRTVSSPSNPQRPTPTVSP